MSVITLKVTVQVGDQSIVVEKTMSEALDGAPDALQQALAEYYDECGGAICPAAGMLYGTNGLSVEETARRYAEALATCVCGAVRQIILIDAATVLISELKEIE